MKITIIACLILFIVCNANANPFDCPIKLSQHSTDKNKKGKAARFAYLNSQKDDVIPEDKETYAIDAALSITCAHTKSNDYFFAIEFHKNDLTSKETDTSALRAGYSFNRLDANNYLLFLTAGILNDEVKDEQSIQLIADVQFLYDDWNINNILKFESSAFVWSPVVALELESVIDDPEDETGSVVRLMYGIDANYYFSKSESVGYRFSISANYTHWNNVFRDDELALNNNHELIVSTFSWILGKSDKHEVALSYKYQKGEDIRNRIADNEFDEVALTVKYEFD